MNEQFFAFRVRQHLNRGLQELAPEITNRLAASRELALAAQRQRESVSALATAGSFLQHHWDGLRFKQALTSVALFVCVVFSTFWLADQRITELGAIDSALLADELPIGAFTDKGFHAWLKGAGSD
jgi:hypothetical protein